jgi:predicted transcriptional regulator|tara:strand:+ start:1737 stop:2033 length:297 start_codon:yes stop_codon:yes gene_type:complete
MEKEKKYLYLSEIKWKVLQYINTFNKEKTYSPTYKEIALAHNFSRARAGAICSELFKLGLISKSGNSAHRKIRLTRKQVNLIPTLHFNKEYPTMEINS